MERKGVNMPPVINAKLCISCGKCREICEGDVFYASKKGSIPVVSYPDECWHCGACMIDCKAQAIHIELPLFMRLVPEPYRENIPEPSREY